MEIIKPRTLSGFMELLPEKQLKFDRMAEKRKSKFIALPRATATLLCAST